MYIEVVEERDHFVVLVDGKVESEHDSQEEADHAKENLSLGLM